MRNDSFRLNAWCTRAPTATVFVALCFMLLGLAGPLPARAQGGTVYRVTMSNPGLMGMTTDCSADGYVLAHWVNGGNYLQADGNDLDANGNLGPDLFLRLLTDVDYTRKYNPFGASDPYGRTFPSGTFNGCRGATFGSNGYQGNLFIFFESRRGQPTIRFIWHFDYFLGPKVREHFTLTSERMPFTAWTGGDISGHVKGKFDIQYYYYGKYESITGGLGRYLEFDLNIFADH